MGGAGGHMNHPHDLDHVRNAKDFIDFFVKELPSILFETDSEVYKNQKFTVKLDGVNAAIKFHIHDIQTQDGKHDIDIKAAIQRGAKKDTKEPHYSPLTRFDEGHGMIPVYNDILNIANKAAQLTLVELKSKGLNAEKFFGDLASRNIANKEGESEVYYDFIFDIEAIYPGINNIINYDNFRSKVNADKIFVLNGIKKYKLIEKKEKIINKAGKATEKSVSLEEEEYLDIDNLMKDENSAAKLLYNNIAESAKVYNIIFKRRVDAEFLLNEISKDILKDISIEALERNKRKKNVLVSEVKDVFEETISFGDGDTDKIINFLLRLDKIYGESSIHDLNNSEKAQIKIIKNGVEAKSPLRFINKETFYTGIYLNKINMLTSNELKFLPDLPIVDQKKIFEILKCCAVIWEAERRLGNVYLKYFSGKLIKPNQNNAGNTIENFDIHSDDFKHEGVVIEVDKGNEKLRFKLTGEFIVSSMASQFKK